MPPWCTWSTLYKGIFALVFVLILLEYLYGSLETRNWENLLNFNTTRLPKTYVHSPLVKVPNGYDKSVLLRALWNATSQNFNSTGSINSTLSKPQNISEMVAFFDTSTVDQRTRLNSTSPPLCPDDPPDLIGRIPVEKTSVPNIFDLERRFDWLKPGGHWAPQTCRAEKKLALVIPFRCRAEHLLIFLQHMHPFLKKQQLDYTIFIIEQDGVGPFNRAMLMNVGFKEALKVRNFDCFIFHDIDLLPEDDRNIYSCPQQPRHMSVAVDIFKYRLPYRQIFGGVSAISRDHFELLNGFSNKFWGWGGEDDDMSNRISYHNLHISRYPQTIARYTMLTHKKDKPSPNRYEILKSGMKRFNTDGLNSLKYSVKQLNANLLYTWMLVEIKPPS